MYLLLSLQNCSLQTGVSTARSARGDKKSIRGLEALLSPSLTPLREKCRHTAAVSHPTRRAGHSFIRTLPFRDSSGVCEKVSKSTKNPASAFTQSKIS